MTYQSTLDWLYSLEAAKGMDFKLERVQLALDRLGKPHRAFRSIHVAGTNGKGSVAAMLHAILHEAGYRTGLYTSPHLVRFTERVRIGNDEISEQDVVDLSEEIQNTATTRGIGLTFFELVTVMSFLHFARKGVEIAVVEVGLGGRLDATNVIEPLASVITTIGKDHTEYLGTSLASIAREKGGIIKQGTPVVIGRIGIAARRELRKIAHERNAPFIELDRDFRLTGNSSVEFRMGDWRLTDMSPNLTGHYQRDNISSALATLHTLKDEIPVSEAAIRRGLKNVQWPGRFEIVNRNPLVILDGAHNCEGMAALVSELARYTGQHRAVRAVFAVMRDKPWKQMARALASIASSVVVTEVPSVRGLPADKAARFFARLCPTLCEPDPKRAFSQVCENADQDDVIVVTGSLFLLGAVDQVVREAGGKSARMEHTR